MMRGMMYFLCNREVVIQKKSPLDRNDYAAFTRQCTYQRTFWQKGRWHTTQTQKCGVYGYVRTTPQLSAYER